MVDAEDRSTNRRCYYGHAACAGTPAAKGASGEASAIPAVDEARLNTVRIPDRVLQYGRDRYWEKLTPPVRGWPQRGYVEGALVHKGERGSPSNLGQPAEPVSHPGGLSNLTGDPRYRKAAEEAIAYHFEHLRSPCGLLPGWPPLGGSRHRQLRGRRSAARTNSSSTCPSTS